ncbi:MAG: CHAT domain-containing protein [Okeania sp. SIO3B5]|uniref:CHAT domain-containing protein n=1 Tax=Okeania sp. SIO3B5 TaxID=2607811 RepID=UPI0013FEC14F|nr:CHAT domain-containing protein [Okeania sp. SIO3B5]NEO53856.1 CHAT domain-containing protein [Okeania sp. SIO3B5]
MKLITLHLFPLMSFVSLLGTVALPVYSQPITPANDGTGTTVNQNGNQFNIQGGTHNGTNLFHSFGKFNLNSGQTANFISTPDTRNILGRITGGNPSIINGLIQVIGGNSNLFLMNPTGIIFGPNASLNIPASFSVTTATGIGFNSNNFWFQAIGTNDYSNLVGNPSGYNFNVSNPGAIINQGNLSLNPGQDLTLTGGTVINTGELSTAGGNVTIAAVNGGDTLRISQPGHLLSLDVSPTANNLSGQSITPMSLPELLTGGDIDHASSVVINAQGNLELTDTAGVAIASGNIDVSDTSNGSAGGQVNVLGDRVAVIDANINANGQNGGGKILIGGDFQGNGIVPNSQQTFVNNNSIISADAINNGEGGQVIIWSDNTTNFAGNISAKGGNFYGDGGFVEISGKEQLIFDGNVNVSAAFGETGTILFDPKNIIIGGSESSNEPPEQNEADNVTETEDDNVTFSAAEIEEIEGEIVLQADNDITVNEAIESSNAIELKAGRNININADIDTSQSNSNISLFGNDNSANINNRDQGAGSINQRENTTLNSGSGNITIKLENLGENGDINLANLTTTGQLLINANQGNIRQVSPNSLITADKAIFETQDSGGIGLAETPLRIDVNNLEVLTGEKGVFINSISDLTIGGVSEEVTEISTEEIEGEIILQADNDITVNEAIESSNAIELKAGRNININADIDTSQSNSNISLVGNDNSANTNNREPGAGSINQRENTTLNSGSGNITIRLGNLGENGDINLANLTTTGQLLINANQGNIRQVSPNSLITADKAIFETQDSGGIGLAETPLRIDVNNLEVLTGEQGIFINSISNLTIGGVSEETGISTRKGGEIKLDIDGNFIANEEISTSVPDRQPGTITISSTGNIDTTQTTLQSNSESTTGGDISLTADGNIQTGDINASTMGNDGGGNITINSGGEVDTTEGRIFSASFDGDGGNVTITSQGDLTTGYIDSRSGGSGNGGDITLESTGGNIDTSNEELASFSVRGNGGDVTITSNGDIKTGDIFSSAGEPLDAEGDLADSSPFQTDNTDSNQTQSANGSGGDIALTAEGIIDTSTGTIESFSRLGDGGNVSITSKGDITTGEIISTAGDPEAGVANNNNNNNTPPNGPMEINSGSSGNITIESTEGVITATGEIGTFGDAGDAGDVTINAFGDIKTESIESRTGGGEGGDITIQSRNGSVNTINTMGTETEEDAGIFSASERGNAGNITINSKGDVSTDDVNSSSLNGRGGDITIESTGGIDTSSGEISSLSQTGDAGNVTLDSNGDLITGNIDSNSKNGNGGSITLLSTNGNIDTTGVISGPVENEEVTGILSASEQGDAGNITITSNGNLTTGNVNSSSLNGNGGNITLESTGGNINTTSGELASLSQGGNAGSVNIKAVGDINTGNIDSQTQAGQGGDITLESTGGSLDTTGGEISSGSIDENSGNVTITSNGNLTTGNIDSRSTNGQAGNITLESIDADVDTSAGEIRSSSRNGNAGNVSLTSQGDIKTGEISSFAGIGLDEQEDSENSSQNESGSSNGGDITLKAGGSIDTTAGTNDESKLESFSREGSGGDISLEAKGDITTAEIISSAGDPDASNPEDNTKITPLTETEINDRSSGDISIVSTEGAVTTTGQISSFATSGNGGSVTIKSNGDLKTSDINSRSDVNGRGGSITLESTNGNIDTTGSAIASLSPAENDEDVDPSNDDTSSELSSFSELGNAGDVTITSNGDINTGDIDSRSDGRGQGGKITLESTNGNIDTTGGELVSKSETGSAGSVTIKSQDDINTGNINSRSNGSGQGGNITLLSTNGNIDTTGVISGPVENEEVTEILSASEEGNAGNITITSNGNLTTGNIDSRSRDGNGGNITLESIGGNINTTSGELASLSKTGSAGNVTIKSQGDINTGNIDSRSDGSGQGGNITLESTNGNIDTTGGEIVSKSQAGNAGSVNIKAVGDINTGNIDSQTQGGQGGDITLESTGGNIDTVGIDEEPAGIFAASREGDAGNTTIISNGDLTTGNIDSRSRDGQSGNITLESTGGNIDTTVGELASSSRNGSAGNVSLTSHGDIKTGEISSFAGRGIDDQEDSENLSQNESGSSNGGDITLKAGGSIDTSAGTNDESSLESFSREGSGGNITLEAKGDITTARILSSAGDPQAGNPEDNTNITPLTQAEINGRSSGDISIESTEGAVTTTAEINSFATSGNGGSVTIKSRGDLTTSDINSRSDINGRGGNITLESTNGNIDTTGREIASLPQVGNDEDVETSNDNMGNELSSFSELGDAGDVTIKSHGDLTTGGIDSRSDGNGNGGNITLESITGNVDTSEGRLFSFSESGSAGNVTITSNGNLTTGDIDSRSKGSGQGGNITLESITGNVNTTNGEEGLSSFSESGNAGDVTITSNGNLTTGNINSTSKGSGQGGNITLESITGNVNTTNGEDGLSSFSESGNAGDVTITSNGNLTTGDINSTSRGSGQGGNITLESTSGNIETTNGELSSFSESGDAGDVTITSNGNLTTGDINSTSRGSGQGGNITLKSTSGNVETTNGELSSFSRSGDAGDVTITSNGDLIIGDIFSSSGEPRDLNNQDNSSGDVSVSQANPQQTDNSNSEENTGGRGGSITLIAEGEINTTAGVIASFSRRGEGGDISLEAKGNITTNEILSSAGDPEDIPPRRENTENATITQSQLESEKGSPGGDISVQSLEGNVTTQGKLISYSNQGDGGNVSVIGNGDINTAGIDSRADRRGRGGNILIQSQTGSIDTANGDIASSSRTGDGGNIEIIGVDNIQVDTIFSESEGNGNGGDVTITGNSNITTAAIESFAGGSGTGGNISITTTDGAIDTSAGELVSSSQEGEGGNVILNATGDISTGFIESFSGAGARGGNITLETINGNIDTTVGSLVEEVNIPTDADVSSEDVATTFEQELANLSSYAPEGTGGNIAIIQRGQGDITTSNISSFGGESSGSVNISNNDGNINTGVIFSTAINGTGDRIFIETLNNGDLNINHIATYSSAEDGTGGEIKLNASGVVNINNVASFGNAGSGDVSIESNSGSINTGTIQTRAPNGTSGNITLNTFSTQGDIRTANVTTEGGEAAGQVQIIAPDGSVTTEDLQSSSESGSAGGIDVQAGEDIETGDQTVDSAVGDANINNQAGGDITTGDQTATTQEGDASINNQAAGNITTGDQTAVTNQGNASINNQAAGNITTGDQTAVTNQGNASINNQAAGNITTGDQTAVTNQGNASINNQAAGNITTGDQTAVTNQGNASINNQAGGNITTGDQTAVTNQGNASINNQAAGNITTGDQTAVTNQGNASINNQAGGNITTGDQTAITNQGNASINNQAAGNITTGDQTAITNQGNASINNQAAGNITTGDQTAIGNTTNIINLPGGELNTGEIIQITPPPSIPIDNTLPQILPQTPITPTTPTVTNLVPPPITPTNPTVTNLVPPPITPTNPTVTNLVPPPITPTTPTNNILPPNNSISNPTVTNIIQSVQSNSTISTTNNPNLPDKKGDRQQIDISTDIKNTLKNINILNNTPLTVAANFQTLTALEKNRNNSFTNYFGEDLSTSNISIENGEVLKDSFGEDLSTQNTSIKNIREVLTDIARETGKNSAIIYVTAYPEELQLVLYTSDSDPILKTVPAANRKQLMEVVLQLRIQITNPSRRKTQSYLPPAKKLYNWLIAPIAAELEAANIDTLLFSMDEGLRTLPVAVLHDGEQFLVEKYSLSLIPSISLMDTNYRPIQDTQVLAMGASEFTAQSALPAVPVELETISQQLWQGSQFLNQDFTRNNLLTQRQNYPYPIVHLATHAEFRPGVVSNSYIQLWGNQKLQLDEIRELGWNDPPVELLVLSACRTAVGDKNAELGFAGLAVAAGAKSALASVWYVSDEGTLGLMTEFYSHLNNAKIKAEALRQAQLAMLRGEVVITEGKLRGTAARGAVALPLELGKFENQNLSHPYYWAGFTMVGSPW